jgi:hypothetical protein
MMEAAVSKRPSVALAVGVVWWIEIASFTMARESMTWIRALPSRVMPRKICDIAMIDIAPCILLFSAGDEIVALAIILRFREIPTAKAAENLKTCLLQ